MNRNVALSIATFLMVAASAAQAQDMLVASATSLQNAVVESPATTGGFEDASWKEYYPFPRHFGPID
jgi:hypothetical protein